MVLLLFPFYLLPTLYLLPRRHNQRGLPSQWKLLTSLGDDVCA